jgi:type II secretory pathway component PulC
VPNTSKGRVVYERKPHLFTYRDVLRIVRKVEPSVSPGPAEFTQVAAALIAVFADLVAAVKDPKVDTPTEMLEQVLIEVLILVLDLLSFVVEKTGRRLQRVIDLIQKFF